MAPTWCSGVVRRLASSRYSVGVGGGLAGGANEGAGILSKMSTSVERFSMGGMRSWCAEPPRPSSSGSSIKYRGIGSLDRRRTSPRLGE